MKANELIYIIKSLENLQNKENAHNLDTKDAIIHRHIRNAIWELNKALEVGYGRK